MTAVGNDGLAIGASDLIQTRKNDNTLGVATRQQWIVQQVTDDSPVRLVNEAIARLTTEAERASRAAQRWEQIAVKLDVQRTAHRAEDNEQAD